jgi:transcriptional regulator with XRE-family HTH domain
VTSEIISLGERLKTRREELGLSQSQAARELDVARTAYRLWEMEAARPAPDRWRLIARWLGVSVATMLLAADLIDDDEATQAQTIAGRLGAGDEWDASVDGAKDFFDEERAAIDRRALEGLVSGAEAVQLTSIVERLRSTAGAPRSEAWRRASLTKELAVEPEALAVSRAAVIGVASNIPSDRLAVVVQLTSELIADLIQAKVGQDLTSCTLAISVLPAFVRVRVAVPRSSARPAHPVGDEAGWGWRFVTQLATRWGAGSEGEAYIAWFDVDLPEPGARPALTAVS